MFYTAYSQYEFESIHKQIWKEYKTIDIFADLKKSAKIFLIQTKLDVLWDISSIWVWVDKSAELRKNMERAVGNRKIPVFIQEQNLTILNLMQ